MMTALKIIIGLCGLGVVVFVHELGHFIAARLSGIDVEAFSIGWGKPILKKKIGTVEYRLGLFPLGGYCKMRGDSDYQEIWENSKNGVDPQPGTFFAAKPWKRIVTAAAGPLFNFLFAIIALAIIWGRGIEIETLENRIVLLADIDGQSYPADQGGLLTGDRILTINGKTINHYRDMQESIALHPDTNLSFTVLRDGREHNLSLRSKLEKNGAGIIGVYPWVTPLVQSVRSNSPAEKAGLRPGDRLLAVNPIPATTEQARINQAVAQDVANRMGQHRFASRYTTSGTEAMRQGFKEDAMRRLSSSEGLPPEEIPYTVAFLRIFKDHKPAEFSVDYERNGIRGTAEFKDVDFPSGAPDLGIVYPSISFKTPVLSPPMALAVGGREAVRTFGVSVKSLGLLFRKEIDLNQAVAGPARITYMVGDIAAGGFEKSVSAGFVSVLNFLALISIALCLMNLLPLPILDGGMIILYLIEMIKRKPIHPKAVSVFQTAGMVIIFGLMVFAAFNDILFFANR